ncbi:MAG TPA: RraA family protein [Phycisphaeraceae bacterium]
MTRCQEWIEWGTAAVSDALRACGQPFQAMDGGIRPVDADMRLAGPAFTVRCYPGATWALEQAVELASPGDVLVVDGGGRPDVILMGGLMSTRAKVRGLAGAVLDAAVRDVDHIARLGFPVFSRFICPRAGTFDQIGQWQIPICCGGVPVHPGDWIVADRSGAVVVPRDLISRTAQQAQRIHHRELEFERLLESGLSLAEAAQQAKEKESSKTPLKT